MKKYELTNETRIVFGKTLYRIRALISFGNVLSGDLGGWVESEDNLSQNGDAWVYGDAQVCGDAWVYGNARVYGNALVEKCSHLLCVGAIGSRNGFTTFFRCNDKCIYVICGCFFGRIDEFAARVNAVHGDTKHGKAYRAAIELAKIQIDDVEVDANAAD